MCAFVKAEKVGQSLLRRLYIPFEGVLGSRVSLTDALVPAPTPFASESTPTRLLIAILPSGLKVSSALELSRLLLGRRQSFFEILILEVHPFLHVEKSLYGGLEVGHDCRICRCLVPHRDRIAAILGR